MELFVTRADVVACPGSVLTHCVPHVCTCADRPAVWAGVGLLSVTHEPWHVQRSACRHAAKQAAGPGLGAESHFRLRFGLLCCVGSLWHREPGEHVPCIALLTCLHHLTVGVVLDSVVAPAMLTMAMQPRLSLWTTTPSNNRCSIRSVSPCVLILQGLAFSLRASDPAVRHTRLVTM